MIANISFLADVQKYRRLSGANAIDKDDAVFGLARTVAPFPTITCTYECSGSYQDISWSGSGTIANIGPAPVADIPGGFLMGTIGDEGQKTSIDFFCGGVLHGHEGHKFKSAETQHIGWRDLYACISCRTRVSPERRQDRKADFVKHIHHGVVRLQAVLSP
jgi:hypothetical protein